MSWNLSFGACINTSNDIQFTPTEELEIFLSWMKAHSGYCLAYSIHATDNTYFNFLC